MVCLNLASCFLMFDYLVVLFFFLLILGKDFFGFGFVVAAAGLCLQLVDWYG